MPFKRTVIFAAITITSASLLCACSLRPETTPVRPSTKNNMAAAKDNINLAIDYLQTQDTADAKSKLLQALSEEPNYAPTWYAMAYYEEVSNHLTKAEADYKHAIALAPSSGQTHNNYGTFLCRHGKYRKAVDEFVTAANEESYLHVAGAYENAGMCAMMIPDNDAAKGFFLQALHNNPNRKMSLYELAKIYYKEGNTTTSKAYYNHYAKLTKGKKINYQKLMKKRQILHR